MDSSTAAWQPRLSVFSFTFLPLPGFQSFYGSPFSPYPFFWSGPPSWLQVDPPLRQQQDSAVSADGTFPSGIRVVPRPQPSSSAFSQSRSSYPFDVLDISASEEESARVSPKEEELLVIEDGFSKSLRPSVLAAFPVVQRFVPSVVLQADQRSDSEEEDRFTLPGPSSHSASGMLAESSNIG